jgi:hypothetical protein
MELTVGKLKELIADLPDDAAFLIYRAIGRPLEGTAGGLELVAEGAELAKIASITDSPLPPGTRPVFAIWLKATAWDVAAGAYETFVAEEELARQEGSLAVMEPAGSS